MLLLLVFVIRECAFVLVEDTQAEDAGCDSGAVNAGDDTGGHCGEHGAAAFGVGYVDYQFCPLHHVQRNELCGEVTMCTS